MAIFQTDLGPYVIGSGGAWLSGVYENERAARYAFRFPDADLKRLQDEINEKEMDHDKRIITFKMLQELKVRIAIEKRNI